MADINTLRMTNGSLAGTAGQQQRAIQAARPRTPTLATAVSNPPVQQQTQKSERAQAVKPAVTVEGRTLDLGARRGTYLNIVV